MAEYEQTHLPPTHPLAWCQCDGSTLVTLDDGGKRARCALCEGLRWIEFDGLSIDGPDAAWIIDALTI